MAKGIGGWWTVKLGLPGTSAPQAAQPAEEIGSITKSAARSLGQGTVRPSPPRALGRVFSCRQQLSGSGSGSVAVKICRATFGAAEAVPTGSKEADPEETHG